VLEGRLITVGLVPRVRDISRKLGRVRDITVLVVVGITLRMLAGGSADYELARMLANTGLEGIC
jgi:hypothetical protein